MDEFGCEWSAEARRRSAKGPPPAFDLHLSMVEGQSQESQAKSFGSLVMNVPNLLSVSFRGQACICALSSQVHGGKLTMLTSAAG